MKIFNINKFVFHSHIIWIVYISYMFSSYFEYVTESFFLWQVFYLLFFVLFLYKIIFECILNHRFIFPLIYLCVIQFFFKYLGGEHTYSLVRFSQFIIAVLFFFFSCEISRFPFKYKQKHIRIYYIILFTVLLFEFVQIILRKYYFQLSFSEHQFFRELGPVSAATSFFYEARGLSQFLNISLFISLFVKNKTNKVLSYLLLPAGIIMTFSLGGIIVMFIQYTTKVTSAIINKPRKLLILLLILSPILFCLPVLTNTIHYKVLFNRINGMVLNFSKGNANVIIKNGYKLNHIDYYRQNSSEFEQLYGIHGGSETVSIIGEMSYLLFIIKSNVLFGRSPSIKERFVTLNAFVDLVARLGFVGILLFFIYYLKLFKKGFPIYSFLVFMIFFTAIDGGVSKPQFFFLISLIPIMHNYEFDKYIFENN